MATAKRTCTYCKHDFEGRGVKYCSLSCAGKARIGMVFSDTLGRKFGFVAWNKGRKCPQLSGENSGVWVSDRTLLKDDHKDRGGQLHREWSKTVKKRDGWKCKIANDDCSGKVVAHHILGWSSYPELRYEKNNGITLCQAHHPLRRAEEVRLAPVFQGLVAAIAH